MHNIGQGVMIALKGSNKVTESTFKTMKHNNYSIFFNIYTCRAQESNIYCL